MIELVAARWRPSLRLVPASETHHEWMPCLTRLVLRAGADTVIHPTAVIARGAELGAACGSVRTARSAPDVVIEDGAELVSHVVVDGHTRIGEDVVLYPFCTVGMAPQDLKYRGQPTRCEIGARTQVREHCTIHRGTVTGNGITRVGVGLPADGGGARRA